MHLKFIGPVPIFTTLLGLALLTGCAGFTLRGKFNIAPEFIPIAVQAQPGSSVAKKLYEVLRLNDIPVTTDETQAGFIIHLIEEDGSNRVVAVNEKGKIISSELDYQVVFEGLRNNGQVIVPKQTIEAFREFVNPEVEMLGKSEEAGMIRQDLEQDLADRILRRLRPHLKQVVNPG